MLEEIEMPSYAFIHLHHKPEGYKKLNSDAKESLKQIDGRWHGASSFYSCLPLFTCLLNKYIEKLPSDCKF